MIVKQTNKLLDNQLENTNLVAVAIGRAFFGFSLAFVPLVALSIWRVFNEGFFLASIAHFLIVIIFLADLILKYKTSTKENILMFAFAIISIMGVARYGFSGAGEIAIIITAILLSVFRTVRLAVIVICSFSLYIYIRMHNFFIDIFPIHDYRATEPPPVILLPRPNSKHWIN